MPPYERWEIGFSSRSDDQVIRPPRRVLDFDRLAGQFLPRVFWLGEQGLDLGHVLLLRRGPLVPNVRAPAAGIPVERSSDRSPRRFDDLT